MKSILDRSFQYTPSAKTDLSKTFRRERERLKKLKETEEANKPIQLHEQRRSVGR